MCHRVFDRQGQREGRVWRGGRLSACDVIVCLCACLRVSVLCPLSVSSFSVSTLHLRAYLAVPPLAAVEEHEERDRQKEDHVVGQVPIVWLDRYVCVWGGGEL